MERSHYRRRTYPRKNPGRPPDKVNFREKLIMQGIVSGLMLAVVLLLTVVQNDFTAEARQRLGEAIAYSPERVTQEIQNITQKLSGDPETSTFTENANNPVNTGSGALTTGGGTDNAAVVSDADIPRTEPHTDSTAHAEDNTDFRIDEDVLADLTGEAAQAQEDLKTTAPVPSALPEPLE